MEGDWLIGQTCIGVERHTESSSAFRLSAATLVVESLWRILADGRLRRTSNDDGQRFGLPATVDAHAEATSLLTGRRVKAVAIDSVTGDLTLTFDGPTILQAIPDSSGYEAWQINAPGRLIVCGRGGLVHELTPEV